MQNQEQEQRRRVIAIAETWIQTPFHWGARLRGVGVDCANFIAAVYEDAGIFKAEEWKFFPRDWHKHTEEEHYLFRLLRYAAKLPTAAAGRPGDIVLARVEAKVFDQAGILDRDGWVIQAHPSGNVRRTKLEFDPLWCGWEKAYFDPWAMREQMNVISTQKSMIACSADLKPSAKTS